jgi:hypothetical protein
MGVSDRAHGCVGGIVLGTASQLLRSEGEGRGRSESAGLSHEPWAEILSNLVWRGRGNGRTVLGEDGVDRIIILWKEMSDGQDVVRTKARRRWG